MLSQRYKSLLNQSALYGLGLFLMKGIALIMLPVYTHYLTPNEYGKLEVLVVFANVFSIILGFGLVEALYRFVGFCKTQEDKEKCAGECLFIAFIIAIISLFSFYLLAATISSLLPGQLSESEVFLIGVALAVGGVINVPLAWLRINDKAFIFFKVTMAKVLIQIILTLILLELGYGITSILFAGAASAVVIAIYLSVLQLSETGSQFSSKSLLTIANYGLPILVGGIATFALSGMDRWLLAEYFGAEQIASYAIAIKFALVPSLLIQPFTLWWYPKRFSVLKEENGKSINAHFSIVGASLSVLMCGGVGLVGPYLIQYLTPNEYHDAIHILPWLLLCAAIKMVSELLNLGCYVDKDSKLQMNINLVSCGVGALLLFALIPSFNISGALAALIFANITRLALFYYFSQQQLQLPYKFTFLYTSFGVSTFAVLIGQ